MKIPFPLERKDFFVYRVMAACLTVLVSSAFISPYFAVIFLAASIVGLPALLLYFAQKPCGMAGSFVRLFSLLIYLSFAESVIVPALSNAIFRVGT